MTSPTHTVRKLVLPLGLLALGSAHAAPNQALIERGGYLVRAMTCSDCHTPWKMGPKGPAPDFSRGLSGHPENMPLPPTPSANGPWLWGGAATNTAFWGPWGVSFAANLTPDPETGIGNWRVEDFIKTLRSGQHLGVGRPILPPMPWPGIKQLTDHDLTAIFAYLKAQPPVRNAVPQAQPPAAATAATAAASPTPSR
jgi:cytochrome c553